MKTFAIVLVCYNRLEGLRKLLSSLETANYQGRSDINLIFSIDYSGNEKVLRFAESYSWPHGPKTVRYFSERQGLRKHILQCGDITKDYDIIAVLEDDLYVSDSFYCFAYQAANFYENDDNIAGISLYSFQKNWLNWIYRFEPQKSSLDAFFMRIAQSWGQVWTYKKWNAFKKWYSVNPTFTKSCTVPEYLNSWPDTSWLKFHDKYCIEENKFFVYPYISLSTNFSDAGEHSKNSVSDHQVELLMGKESFLFGKFQVENSIVYDEYMERIGLGKFLGIGEDELTVNLWGNKRKEQFKKYVLSSESLGFQVEKAFDLGLRPIELSIMKGLLGHRIFLYNTSKATTRKKRSKFNFSLLAYSLRTNHFSILFKFSLQGLLRKIWNKVRKKRP